MSQVEVLYKYPKCKLLNDGPRKGKIPNGELRENCLTSVGFEPTTSGVSSTYPCRVNRNGNPFVENDYHKVSKGAEQKQHLEKEVRTCKC